MESYYFLFKESGNISETLTSLRFSSPTLTPNKGMHHTYVRNTRAYVNPCTHAHAENTSLVLLFDAVIGTHWTRFPERKSEVMVLALQRHTDRCYSGSWLCFLEVSLDAAQVMLFACERILQNGVRPPKLSCRRILVLKNDSIESSGLSCPLRRQFHGTSAFQVGIFFFCWNADDTIFTI